MAEPAVENEDLLETIIELLMAPDLIEREDLEALITCLQVHARHNRESAEAMGSPRSLPLAQYFKIDSKSGEVVDSIQYSPTAGGA